MIIGLMGLAGVGKSTAGKILRDDYGFEMLSFADSLKDGVAVLFSWPRHLLEGDSAESRKFRETPDEYWSDAFGFDVTPRYVMQRVGTDFFRNWLGDFWVRSVGNKIRFSKSKDFVITDMRFVNEIEFVQKNNGFIVTVLNTKNVPDWLNGFMHDYRGLDIDYIIERETYFSSPRPHRSEWEHIYWNMQPQNTEDFVLYNDYSVPSETSIQNLRASIQHMVRLFSGPVDDAPIKNEKLDISMVG